MLLQRSCQSGTSAVARAFKWISDAPRALYERKPSVIPELCDSLLARVRQLSGDGDIQYSMINIVKRAGSEAGRDVRQTLSAKMLRFAFDNVRIPLGALVAEIFSDVYLEVVKGSDRPLTFFASLSWHTTGKGKDLNFADRFLFAIGLNPGHLAVVANNLELSVRYSSGCTASREGMTDLQTTPNIFVSTNDPCQFLRCVNIWLRSSPYIGLF